MAKLSLGEAAKTAGIGKTSLRRAIDAGRISAHKTEGGHFLIDPSELARFMDVRSDRAAPPSIVKAAPHGAPGGAAQIGRAAPPETDLEALSELETRALLAEQRAELLAAHLAETRADREALREDMADLRRDRDAWRAQAERLLIETQKDPEEAKAAPPGAPGGAALIDQPMSQVDPPTATEERRPGFWRRLFGKG